ncbi:tyrosine-protein phosphatase [Nocardioides sp.]|uniref:tyrosine-protein phosphatase n=1 Tax=Nocardioides sp. TaxID=35761 RepID=UPI0035161DEA
MEASPVLVSADNFRDVAGPGLRAADGAPLRAGVLFRSNELRLIEEDTATLTGLGLVAVHDLREGYEVDLHPDVPVPGTTWHHRPVPGIPHAVGAQLRTAEESVTAVIGVYLGFVDDDRATASFGALLRDLAAATGPQLFHCTAGKDRTGWTAALLLHLAGVAWADIEADYLVTNDRSAATRAKYLGMVAEHLGADRVPAFEPLMLADVAYLRAARDRALAVHGTLETYLADGLGVDADAQAALTALLRGAGVS